MMKSKIFYYRKDQKGFLPDFILELEMMKYQISWPFFIFPEYDFNYQKKIGQGLFIESWLSRCNRARGSGTRLFLVGPTKVKAFLFTVGSLKVENKF